VSGRVKWNHGVILLGIGIALGVGGLYVLGVVEVLAGGEGGGGEAGGSRG
jgi:hypothetical protein